MEQRVCILLHWRRGLSHGGGRRRQLGISHYDGIVARGPWGRKDMVRKEALWYKHRMMRLGYRIVEMEWSTLSKWLLAEEEASDEHS